MKYCIGKRAKEMCKELKKMDVVLYTNLREIPF